MTKPEPQHTAPAALTTPGQEVAATRDDGEPAGLHGLLAMCATYMSPADLDLICRAFVVAERAHHGTRRVSGEPFIEHPLAVARVLASLAMDADGIAAALLHDTVEDTSYTLAEIEDQFGAAIAEIVDGVTKFELVGRGANGNGARPTSEQRIRQQQETVRKLLLAMMRDPRVVVLKLADRLHNLRTLASMSPSQRAAKARETMEIYVPLAAGIGLQVFKSELEDLAFSYQQPEEFERISRTLRHEAQARMEWAERVREHVQRTLQEEGIVAAVNWRLKHPYRAYRETQDSGMAAADLHDIIAFRVLVNTELDCYRALGVIHSVWHPMDRIRDYVATPKVNGYRSLHTAVYAFDERKAQFHIRTHEMHRLVQHGVACHWLERAARGEPVDGAWRLAIEDMPNWVAQLDDWQRELRLSADAFYDTLKRDLFDDQVYVFTPGGDIIDLPSGSTPLDFAYRIHSGLGDHYAGARVQTMGPGAIPLVREVPPEYRVRTGDVLTVLKAPNVQARPEWLGIARTRNAREKIARTLRALHNQEDGARRSGEPSAESEPELSAPVLHPSGRPARLTLGRCCYPCPGDGIMGLPGRGDAITVHRACCRTLRAVEARRKRTPSTASTRFWPPISLDWSAFSPMTYRMAVAVYGQDHAGLMHELAVCMKKLGINLSATSALAIQDRNKAIVTLVCEIPPTVPPGKMFRALHAIPGVTLVERNTRLGCVDPGTPA